MTSTTSDRPTPFAGPPAGLPTPGDAVSHTLLNCLLREVSEPERQTAVSGGRLLLRLPRAGVLLRVALRRTSLLGAHRFSGPVSEERDGNWTAVGWRRLAEHTHAELSLRTGVPNDEFLAQISASHRGVSAALSALPHRRRATAGHDRRLDDYLASEQSLVLGHRFHPTPKAHGGDPAAWSSYAPDAGVSFPLRMLAVRDHLVAEEHADPEPPHGTGPLDRLAPVPPGYRLLPAHPWQYAELGPALRPLLATGDVLDLGTGRRTFTPTASVRTLYDGETFLKFSLNVRITNCLRKNSAYELSGAVALTRLLGPALDDLAARFPGSGVLREPAYRSLAVPGPGGRPDTTLLEGFGVIVREGLRERLRPGVTPLLAASVADEYPTGPGHVSALGPAGNPATALAWWRAYLALLVPPVLAAYFDHGLVLEPHLQNVVVGVGDDGRPVQILFRDLEGTKLLPEHHAAALAALPPAVAAPMTYDARRGWDRVVYCLFVNHVAELLAALADLHPQTEAALWSEVRRTVRRYADEHGCPPQLSALLAGVPLPAKANLLTRWERSADRHAGYVRLPSPLAEDVLRQATRNDAERSPS
ncbi:MULTISPECIES: IucA/IucC family protein [Streptomyces]|uniref:Iron transporter n=1 Tax=Streptomyces tsukubensis (strain DSM 42081 / NBRC 108919 / NRRL 18488 / 9993) TaxID=1114943 RepID=I2MT76_STRT9|nr:MULTISPECIES: IucA/IucC family protein [Streptomyces]AZK92578.1 iron transporter [Streptomyces tsukubensis]EIF87973.1 iron transport protein [Streptomyces tsukubensis NRRL18488]MYS62772.1 iron transporter [Streptomyces sp. SID5473]QKM71242.1 iron transporter [Streptomyces tsukubensis NRRL18488]TAI40408.1 iron transporter [Streptomyces tsukubensis]